MFFITKLCAPTDLRFLSQLFHGPACVWIMVQKLDSKSLLSRVHQLCYAENYSSQGTPLPESLQKFLASLTNPYLHILCDLPGDRKSTVAMDYERKNRDEPKEADNANCCVKTE
jgi:hypothetical protein